MQGILEPNLIPSREFESRSREFGALPEIPTRLSVADRVLDQFPADGAEENNLYCNPAPNGDKRHADRRSALIFEGLAWADINSNESKKMPHAHDGAGVESARSFLPYGPKQS